MKKVLVVILGIFLTLPFRDGLGLGYSAFALSFEVQVPIASRGTQMTMYTTSNARVTHIGSAGFGTPVNSTPSSSYRPSQTVINMSTTSRPVSAAAISTGRFTTYVPAVDASGHAQDPYAPNRPRPRKVEDEDHEIDPYMPANVAPLGDTPWILLILLLLGYAAFAKRRQIFKK